MRKFLFLSVLICYFFTANAQFKMLASSGNFEEPETGYAKILFLRNKNTVYVHVTHEGELTVKMYDATRKPVFNRTVTTQFGKLKKMSVKNLFETNGNLTLFFAEQDGSEQKLCRIVLDSKDGRILKQDVLAEMGKVSTGKKYAIAMGGVDMPDFYVRHNPAGSSYAVAVYNSFASESEERIEIIQYNGEHQETFRTFVSTPQNEYKYVNMLDMVLSNDKQAHIWVYGFNTQKNEGGEAFIATVDGSDKSLTFKRFYEDVGRKSTEGILRYDATNKRFVGVTQAITHSKGKWNGTDVYYEIRRFVFDPATGNTVEQPVTGIDRLDEQTKDIFGKRDGFEGVLQNFYVNADGTQTLIFEGLRQETTSSGSRTSIRVSMRNSGVITYDKDGVIISTSVIPFSHMINNNMLMGGGGETYRPLEHYNRTSGGIKLKGGNQFKSFFYINGSSKDYILLNDIIENQERLQNDKGIVTIQGLERSDAFIFDADGASKIPQRRYLFGAPSDKKSHNIALLTLSDYDHDQNVYVTLRVDADGKKKTSRLVWMTPE